MGLLAVLSVVVLCVAPVRTDAGPQCPQFEVEAVDTDVAGAILAERAADTSDGCCSMCGEVDGCQGYAYMNQVCYLKGNFSGTFFQTGVVSRLKRALGAGCPGFQGAEQGTDLVGDPLDEWSAPNPEVCCAACAEKGDCQGFAFFGGRCYLKANVRGTYSHEGCMVRVKEGVLPERSSSPAPAQPQCPQFEVEAVDTDVAGALLAVRAADTSDGCCSMCGEVDGCQGYAYVNHVCYLKGNFSGTFFQTGVVSRLKRTVGAGCPGFQGAEQGKDLVGDALDEWSAPNPEVCCAACSGRSDCQGFAFFGGRCYLKANVRGTYSHEGCMVRVKEGVLSGCPGFAAEQNDKDLAGDLLDVWSAPRAEHCCAACALRPDCQGFAFFEGFCSLKGNVQGTYHHSGSMVQTKAGVLSEGGGGRRLGGVPLLV